MLKGATVAHEVGTWHDFEGETVVCVEHSVVVYV